MFVSVQSFGVGPLGIQRRFWGAYAHGIWVHVVLQTGMAADEDLLGMLGFGRPTETRNVIGLDLRGRSVLRFRSASHELTEGAVSMLPGRGSYRSRIEASTEPSLSMILEVDRSLYPGPPFAPCFGTLRTLDEPRRLTLALCTAIEEAWSAPSPESRASVETAFHALASYLRALGFPLPAIDLRDSPEVTPWLGRVGRAVDTALSQTRSRPMLVDLEALCGRSARTLQRAMPLLCRVWGQSPETFGAHARRVQLGRAVSAMTNSRATTEGVARELGFSTANAFCRAMAQYGLPSPGAVRSRFAALA